VRFSNRLFWLAAGAFFLGACIISTGVSATTPTIQATRAYQTTTEAPTKTVFASPTIGVTAQPSPTEEKVSLEGLTGQLIINGEDGVITCIDEKVAKAKIPADVSLSADVYQNKILLDRDTPFAWKTLSEGNKLCANILDTKYELNDPINASIKASRNWKEVGSIDINLGNYPTKFPPILHDIFSPDVKICKSTYRTGHLARDITEIGQNGRIINGFLGPVLAPFTGKITEVWTTGLYKGKKINTAQVKIVSEGTGFWAYLVHLDLDNCWVYINGVKTKTLLYSLQGKEYKAGDPICELGLVGIPGAENHLHLAIADPYSQENGKLVYHSAKDINNKTVFIDPIAYKLWLDPTVQKKMELVPQCRR